MNDGQMSPDLREATERYSDIYVIVSPPRCSSTAFARVLWQHPSVGYYSHEPFEVTYFDGAGLDGVLRHRGDVVRGIVNGIDTEVLPDDATGEFPLVEGDTVLIEGHLTLTHDAPVRLVATREN